MASLKGTKRRIISVKSTQKITRAMKLVSSAKYARSLTVLNKAKPYAEAYLDLTEAVAAEPAFLASPYVQGTASQDKIVICVATDRGLCGGLNANLFRELDHFLQSEKGNFSLMAWGKRAQLFCQKRPEKLLESEQKVLEKPNFEFAKNAAYKLIKAYESEAIGEVYIAYSSFKNALTQTPVIKKILPLSLAEKKANAPISFEPQVGTMLGDFVQKKIASEIFLVLLEGAISEHAARMAAMDNATNNADEVIKRLTLEYNRARQAAITKELIEITSGAEAL